MFVLVLALTDCDHFNIQAAIDSGRIYWNKAAEPECFEEYVKARDKLKSRHSEWTSNKESGYCLLCLNKFGYFGRHHCRACGILCCQLCSSKRLTLRHPSPKGAIDRVCDGCFNKLTAEAEARQIAVAKAQKIMDAAAPEEELGRPMSPLGKEDGACTSEYPSPLTTEEGSPMGLPKVKSSGSLAGGFSPVNPILEKSASTDQLAKQQHSAALSASKSFNSANNAVNEAGEALRERGVKLQAVGERSEALAEV